MLPEIFEEHCDIGLYTIERHLSEYIVESIRRLGAIPVFDNSPYEHFNGHT